MTKNNSVAGLTVKRLFFSASQTLHGGQHNLLAIAPNALCPVENEDVEFLLYKLFWPHFERIYELKPETQPKCKNNKLSELSNAQTTIQSIDILATEEVVWNVTTASNSKHLGICVFAGQKIYLPVLCA